ERECQRILDTAEQMTRYTKQAARIRKLTGDKSERQNFTLASMIAELIETNSQLSSDVDVSVSVPDDIVIEASPMFDEALNELITNAIRHNDSNAPAIEIRANAEMGPHHLVEIQIADNGTGIPPSEIKALQDGKEDQLLHLSGMGLWFVEWAIRHSDGEISFEYNEMGGSTVCIRIPKSPRMLISTFVR
ncbi:MAG: sensor histidine kinase, partial [Halobacteriaceae archaeon]